MKNIVMIVQKLEGGGAERAVANLSRDLSNTFNIILIVFDGSKVSYPYSGRLIDLKLPPKKSIIGKIITLIKRVKYVKSIKKDEEVFCSISFMPGANIVNLFSKVNDLIITSERNMMSIVTKSRLQKKLISFVGKHSDKTVSLSNGVKDDLIKNFNFDKNKITTIYNSCDKKWFMKTSNQVEEIVNSLDKKYKYIVTVGRLHSQKGQKHLIKAFKKVEEEISNVRLIILGKGELENELKTLVNELGIEEKVLFLGYIKNHHKLLEKCEVFVLSSIVEGLGNVLLEAMACGLPIISTDCFSGPREIIAPDTDIHKQTDSIEKANFGILVPAYSIEDMDEYKFGINNKDLIMANAIIEMLKNKNLQDYYRTKSLERISDFSSSSIKNQWITLINNLYEKQVQGECNE